MTQAQRTRYEKLQAAHSNAPLFSDLGFLLNLVRQMDNAARGITGESFTAPFMESQTQPLSFESIIARIKAEQIRFADIVRHDERRPEWLGKIKELNYKEGPRTKEELRNHQVILHLLDHDLYIRAHGTKDGPSKGKRNWEYELTQVGRKTEEVPPRPAYTKVWYEAIYPVQTSGYPDPSAGFPSYYAKQESAHDQAAS